MRREERKGKRNVEDNGKNWKRKNKRRNGGRLRKIMGGERGRGRNGKQERKSRKEI